MCWRWLASDYIYYKQKQLSHTLLWWGNHLTSWCRSSEKKAGWSAGYNIPYRCIVNDKVKSYLILGVWVQHLYLLSWDKSLTTLTHCFGLSIGKYKTQLYDENIRDFLPSSPGIGMHVEVKDPNMKVILSKYYASEGRFTFTSHSPGEHLICLHSNSTRWSLWAGGKLVG